MLFLFCRIAFANPFCGKTQRIILDIFRLKQFWPKDVFSNNALPSDCYVLGRSHRKRTARYLLSWCLLCDVNMFLTRKPWLRGDSSRVVTFSKIFPAMTNVVKGAKYFGNPRIRNSILRFVYVAGWPAQAYDNPKTALTKTCRCIIVFDHNALV